MPQTEVYSKVVSPLVSSFHSGINCTVFAYGQTGSGKTYTLGSDALTYPTTKDAQGIIPRAIEEIFHVLKETEEEVDRELRQKAASELRVSYIEVYKEEVRDLISDGSDVHIREDESGQTGLALFNYSLSSCLFVCSYCRCHRGGGEQCRGGLGLARVRKCGSSDFRHSSQ